MKRVLLIVGLFFSMNSFANLDEEWEREPYIVAATTAPEGRFSIAIGVLEYGEQFSAIISYDPRHTQPWSRVDVERETVDITYKALGANEFVPVALSNEGDVYTLHDDVHYSKIPGTGISSDDADGRGEVWKIVSMNSELWVIGDNNQLWRSMGGEWQQLTPPADNLELIGITTLQNQKIVLAGLIALPPEIDYGPADTVEKVMEWLDAAMSRADADREMVFFIGQDSDWEPIKAPNEGDITLIASGPRDELLVTGARDLVLTGTRENLMRLPVPQLGETYYSIARWKDQIWLTSDSGLYLWEDGKLMDFSPLIATGHVSPFGLRSEADRLTYFDFSHGVRIWDGVSWKEILIPPRLKERVFVSLDSE